MTLKERSVTFFRAVLRSCYGLEFYRRVRVGTVGAALRYAVAFYLLLTLVFGLTVVLPGALHLSRVTSDGIGDWLPPESSFEISHGQFGTNLPPGTEFDLGDVELVMDQTVEGREFPLFFDDRTGALIGRDSIFAQRSDGRREVTPLSDLPDFSVTREEMQSTVAAWKWPIVGIALVLVMMFKFVFGLLVLATDVVVVSLLALLLGRILRLKLTYSQWLAVGLHAVTLPTLIDYVFGLFSLQVPFASTVVFLMFMLAVAMDERSRPTVSGQTSLDLSH